MTLHTTALRFTDLAGLPPATGPLTAGELLLLHPERVTPRDDSGVPLEVSALAGYRLGGCHQLVCAASPGDRGHSPVPATHLLDHLVRNHALTAEFETHLADGVHTVALVDELPDCDFCRSPEARYDGYATSAGRRVACFMCGTCFRQRGTGLLGAGYGQVLVTTREIPEQVRNICTVLGERLGRPEPF